ncbi:aminotransferase class I/II-fold pyridoxal phosphate-dependent enzyme [Desulfotomaculum copahuensis]|uniref:Decarboxylase n=1 Tax=Desulfotomaculum copahuensis TaxID=1838280 RepID=A0A1B7LI76_9FIRM|nr:decarboxylase [Desulfotomaculum copahuensis]OAT86120.1 decarboxylase [Desulfotomaculum copahuensis]
MLPDQEQLPLLAALVRHCRTNPARLHVPAHRQGRAVPAALTDLAEKNIFRFDLTELPGLDDLHHPQGAIAAAQQLAAALYGAGRTFFLVNGTTCGLQALLLALCRPGEEILLPRNVHRSVLGGLVLSGARPVYLPPVVIKDFGLAAGVREDTLAAALARHPRARGYLAVYPTYYGLAPDLTGPAAVLHRLDKPLLVDEAHGAHLPFHPALPPPALAQGADASVQSVHKLGGSLTQSSWLHLGGARPDPARVAAALRLLQTSSPSYILLASLDAARRQLALDGRRLLERALTLARDLRRELARIPGLAVLDEEHLAGAGAAAARLDPTRVVISVHGLGLTGYQAARLLAEKHRVMVEMADYRHLVAVTGLGTTAEDCRALVRALREISRRDAAADRSRSVCPGPPDAPPVRLTPRQAWFAPARPVPLEQAAGLVAAETVAVYPPGIPALCPGEEITPEIIEYLSIVRRHGLPVQGPADGTLQTLRVVS